MASRGGASGRGTHPSGDAAAATDGIGPGSRHGHATSFLPLSPGSARPTEHLRNPFGASHLLVRPGRRLLVLTLPHADTRAPLVMFIHGACANHSQHEHQIAALAKHASVVAFDAVGCGNSYDALSDAEYATNELFADAVALYRRFKGGFGDDDDAARSGGRGRRGGEGGGDAVGGGPASTVLVGHSFGTSLVARLAASEHTGDELKAAVLLAPPYHMKGPHPIFRLPVMVLEWLHPAMHAGFVQKAFHPARPDALVETETRRLDNRVGMAKAFYTQMRIDTPTYVASVPAHVAVLVLAGEADQLTPPDAARDLFGALPENRLHRLEVLKGCGHMMMVEAPEEVTRHVLDHLDAVLGRSDGDGGAAGVSRWSRR